VLFSPFELAWSPQCAVATYYQMRSSQGSQSGFEIGTPRSSYTVGLNGGSSILITFNVPSGNIPIG
jgi:hypothetical protein